MNELTTIFPGAIISAEVARPLCASAPITTWCWERPLEAAVLETRLTGNLQLPVWLTCKLLLGRAGIPAWGPGSARDTYSQCDSSPESVPQTDLQGRDCHHLASLLFPSSFPVHCSIIISFSCFQRDVFNNGSPASSAQQTTCREAGLCSDGTAAFWHSKCRHSWPKQKSSVLFHSVQRRNFCCN